MFPLKIEKPFRRNLEWLFYFPAIRLLCILRIINLLMNFPEFFADKSLKAKAQTEILSNWLLENPQELSKLIKFAGTAKDPVKGTCIEAIEFATKQKPEISDLNCLE